MSTKIIQSIGMKWLGVRVSTLLDGLRARPTPTEVDRACFAIAPTLVRNTAGTALVMAVLLLPESPPQKCRLRFPPE